MNGKNAELLEMKRRESASQGLVRPYTGPGDIEAMAKEFNVAVVFTEITALDANTQVVRKIEDSWNGQTWYTVYSDTLSSVGVTRKEVTVFAGFLRVTHEVSATSGTNVVGATFGSGLTYKQT